MLAQTKDFARLFRGLSRARQTIEISQEPIKPGEKCPSKVRCVVGDVLEAHYNDHLIGKMGLGIYPLCDDSKCWFGALDIDDYQLDHKIILQTIYELKLPLHAFRSKSGGLHLFLFGSEPLDPKLVVAYLYVCAGVLNLPVLVKDMRKVELFPKQLEMVKSTDVGAGITIPFFGGDEGNTFGLQYINGSVKPLSLESFLKKAQDNLVTNKFLQELPQQEADEKEFEGAPPCLLSLIKDGVPIGTRAQALYNFGLYAKLRYGENELERILTEYNTKIFDTPLLPREVSATVKSLLKKSYFYKCAEEPICSRCNKIICRTKQFGIKHELLESRIVDIEHVVKLEAENPMESLWIVTIKGQQIQLDIKQISSPIDFKRACIAKLNMVPTGIDGKVLDAKINKAFKNIEIVKMPEDASEYGQFCQLLDKFFFEIGIAVDKTDIMHRCYYEDGKVYFLSSNLMDYLGLRHFTIKPNMVFSYLRRMNSGQETSVVLWVDNQAIRTICLPREKPFISITDEEYRDNF